MSKNNSDYFKWLELLGLDVFFGKRSWPFVNKATWEYINQEAAVVKKWYDEPLIPQEKKIVKLF